MSNEAEKWIDGHLDRLREETADWPEWMKKPIKPIRVPKMDKIKKRDDTQRSTKAK